MNSALAAAAAAAILSGAPSTLHALASGRDPFEAALAAGSIVLPREQRAGPLLMAGACVHGSLSLGWATLLNQLLPERARLRSAVAAGLLIAGLDLGIVGRRFPRIRRLPVLPQLADHVAYALVVAALTGPDPCVELSVMPGCGSIGRTRQNWGYSAPAGPRR